MPRDPGVHLDDIVTAIGRVREYTRGMDSAAFQTNARTVDAVPRNLEVIGEAAKQVPDELRRRAPAVEWKKMAGMRDLIAHAYFAVDLDIVWDVVATKLGPLEDGVRRLRGG